MISVGIDIAKAKIDVYYNKKHYVVTNREKELKKFFKSLPKDSQIVMEATGKYHRLSHKILDDLGFTVMVVNPCQSRNFTKALGLICKTDSVDARMLSLFGEKLDFKQTSVASDLELKLQELSRHLNDLKKLEVSLKARLEEADEFVKKSLQKMIKEVQKQIKAAESKLEELVAEDKELKGKKDLLLTIPGVGKRTALMLLSNLRELGKLPKNEIVALSGLAPRNNESGTFQGKRYVRGGRVGIRSSLFMPILGAATQYNKKLKAFYTRLVENGKSKKVALTACMRKLIVWANYMIANNVPWNTKCS